MPDARAPLRLGLIGCGRATATLHLPALQHVAGVEVAAVADLDAERLSRVADQFRIPGRYPDHAALLRDARIHAVAVCVPARFHVAVALAALEAGTHLFVEKPLALELDECDRLIERARRSSRHVMVGFNLRWHTLLRRARDMVRGGRLGRLQLIRTVFTTGLRHRQALPAWRARRESGGGALFEIAVHHFDLWRFLLGREVDEVFAATRSGQWDDETGAVTARLADGVLATSVFSDSTSDSNEIEIFGDGGRLHVSCYRFDGLHYVGTHERSGDVRLRLRRTARALTEIPGAAWQARQGGGFLASYQAEWRHFVDAIRRDVTPECTLDDGRRALEVARAAIESAARGQPVKLARGASSPSPSPVP